MEGLGSTSKNLCKNIKPEHIAKLKEEHHKGHALCLQKIEQWEKFKKDYEVLKGRLETLPDRISHDIMVPFGSHAFMPGKLAHTNEIMALLGANWFAEVSAKHAAEISQRRISQCEKMLEDLQKEKEQFENWLKYIHEVTGGDLVEINEFCPEEELEKWRGEHRKNVKAYNQKKKQMEDSYQQEQINNDASNQNDEAVDKDYFQILDKLGEKESLYGEMNDTPSEADDEDVKNNEEHAVGDTDENSESEEEEEQDDEDDDDEKSGDSSDEHSKSNGKHVKWKDQEKEKMKNCITFTHSSHKTRSRPMNISKTKYKSKESGPLSPVKIQSPSDIYKCFSTKPEQSKPKSILKRTSSIDESDALTEPVTEFTPLKNTEDDVPVVNTRFKEQTAFTGEIIEHEIDKDSSSEKTKSTAQRPPSRFKAHRQHRS